MEWVTLVGLLIIGRNKLEYISLRISELGIWESAFRRVILKSPVMYAAFLSRFIITNTSDI